MSIGYEVPAINVGEVATRVVVANMPGLLNFEQAQAYLQIGESKFRKMLGDKEIPQPKIVGGMRRWSRAELESWIEALPQDSPEHQQKRQRHMERARKAKRST